MAVDETPLSRLLREHRSRAGLTQEELAERAGLSARAISDIERGLRARTYPETALRLADALGLDPDERSRFETLARGRPSRPSWAEAWGGAEVTGPAVGIPARPTRLIGREEEVERILAALTDPQIHLLTLTGPGGIGKTRLAVEAASRAQIEFPDGVFFLSLAGTRDVGVVLSTIARAFGDTSPQEPGIEALARRLSGKRALLVLDTFEQVLDAAPAIGDLIAAAPGLTVLVTSREILHLRAERELPIPPLELPAGGPDSTLEARLRSPAVMLFLDRARAARPDLVLDDEGTGTMVEICRSLNGLPLAIELAAARIRHLPLAALRDQLEHRLNVLTGGPRDLPRRQQTMRDTIAWSHDLLNPAERSAFAELSVFAAGWTLEAAESICTPHDGGLLTPLSGLVDKSLVELGETAPGTPRYRMLDVIREFATERLDASGAGEVLGRHAAQYLSMAEMAEPDFGRAAQETWFEVLDTEHDNLRAALRWSIEHAPATALRLAAALWTFWLSQRHHTEGRRWLREALAQPAAGPPGPRVTALWGAAWLAYHQGDYDEMEALSAELLPLARAQGEPAGLRNALTVGGMVAMARGRYEEALAPLQQALDLCREMEPGWLLATSLLNLGMASLHVGRLNEARMLLEEARALYQQLGDRRFAARSTQQIGFVGLVEGDPEARSLIATSLEAYRDLGDLGDLGDLWGIAESLEGLSACDAARGRTERAARIAGAAEVLRERLATRPLPCDRELTDRYLTAASQVVENAPWRAAWQAGRNMPLEEAIAYALVPGD